jgi:hypothetical protein
MDNDKLHNIFRFEWDIGSKWKELWGSGSLYLLLILIETNESYRYVGASLILQKSPRTIEITPNIDIDWFCNQQLGENVSIEPTTFGRVGMVCHLGQLFPIEKFTLYEKSVVVL